MVTTEISESVVSSILEMVQRDRSEYDARLQASRAYYMREYVELPLIMVSTDTGGRVAGGDAVMDAVNRYLSERGMDGDVRATGSLGLLSAEPVLSIQLPGRTRLMFGPVEEEDVAFILDDVFHNSVPDDKVICQLRSPKLDAWIDVPFMDEVPFFASQERLLLKDCGIIDPFSIEAYIAGDGYKAFLKTIRHYTFEEICLLMEESGLRGRSGSGFKTGTKWKVAYHTPADQKYLVCNAEESDPGAFMDRALMEGNPHQLIEGMAIASYAIGATKAIIYIRSEYHESINKLERAISAARDYGLLGDNIFSSGFNLDIAIRKGPGAFVCGEETALIASLEGKRGMPQSKPPFPAVRGFHGKPTVINNVETLSNVPHIIRKGPAWYRETGTPESPGTKIFALSGKVSNAGLLEVPMGTSLKSLVLDIAGGPREGSDLKAIHIGGPSGCLLPGDQLDIPISFESLKEAGAVMGAGGILVLDQWVCLVDLVKYFMDFMQHQSCGKCIPCREGTKRMSEILDGISKKPQDDEGHTTLERFKGVMQLGSLAEVMKDTSLCGLGQSAANPVLTALRHFRKEFEEHIFNRNCPANVCTELRTYFIDVDLCTGCSLCAKKCPEDAIIGTERHPYFIVAEKCTGCGICHEVCKFNAVYYK